GGGVGRRTSGCGGGAGGGGVSGAACSPPTTPTPPAPPPPRSRGDDIMLRARHFLDHYRQQYGFPPKMLSPEAEEALLAYSWPGNVRELAHVIERAALLHAGRIVSVEHLGLNRERRPEPILVTSDRSVQGDFAAGPLALD